MERNFKWDDGQSAQALIDEYVPAAFRRFMANYQPDIIVCYGTEPWIDPHVQANLLRGPGCYVMERHTIWLKEVSPVVTLHEYGHALDCILGGGLYKNEVEGFASGQALAAQRGPLFQAANTIGNGEFAVTSYAYSAIWEWFAESFRAYCDAPLTRIDQGSARDLKSCNPSAYNYFQQLEDALDFGLGNMTRATTRDALDFGLVAAYGGTI